MMPATNRGTGANIGFPDVCLTPAGPAVVPVPYPSIGLHAMAVGFSPNVYLTGMSALSVAAILPLTMGDQAGVAHPLLMQMGRFLMGNVVVHVNMLPGICLCSPTTGNLGNNALGSVLLPSVTNVFYTLAPRGADGGASHDSEGGTSRGAGEGAGPYSMALSADDIAALGAELACVARAGGPAVSARMGENGVGMIRIEVFSMDVPARVACAVHELCAGGMAELVIDVRGNPGGELLSFVELAGDFLPSGSVVARVVDGDGDETVHRSWQERPYRFPVTVLVDGDTASAAEMFAGCLAAHGRARVVGGPTRGKDVGQTVIVAPDGATWTATVVRVQTGDVSLRAPPDVAVRRG